MEKIIEGLNGMIIRLEDEMFILRSNLRVARKLNFTLEIAATSRELSATRNHKDHLKLIIKKLKDESK